MGANEIIILKCLLIAFCGVLIGFILHWRMLYTHKPMSHERAKRIANRLYQDLVRELDDVHH